jgi:hypothetical protein
MMKQMGMIPGLPETSSAHCIGEGGNNELHNLLDWKVRVNTVTNVYIMHCYIR